MEDTKNTMLHWLLSGEAKISAREQSFNTWVRAYNSLEENWERPIDRAIAGGFISDRTAFAFLGGYESALRRLVPDLPLRTMVSLCVTEEGGGHPKAIRTALEPAGDGSFLVNGSKKFVTAAGESEILLTAVTRGVRKDGRSDIALCLLDRKSRGITMELMKDLPFVPEISHGTVRFENVPVEQGRILSGDGFARYIRPFRTLEDIHVFGAVLGYLFRVSTLFGWPARIREKLLAVIHTISTMADMEPDDPALHIVLGGIDRFMEDFFMELNPYFHMAGEGTRSRWERDRPLLKVAGTARSKRLEKAWAAFNG